MTTESYYKIAKAFLVIPLLAGLLTIVEQFLPLQKVSTLVASKSINESSKSGTTYSIAFSDNNDQFTEAIYNKVHEGDAVTRCRISSNINCCYIIFIASNWFPIYTIVINQSF